MMWYKRVFVFYFLLLSFVSKGQSIGVPKNYLLKKAQGYYINLEYNKAITFIGKYQHTKKGKNDTLVLVTLGDCYWKLKSYKNADECYQTLSLKKDFELTAAIRFRMAEYAASQHNYVRAKELLNGLSEYKDKANGFEQTDIMLRDSLDYTIQSLKINTNSYREFAPTLIGNRLYYSTNQPESLLFPEVSSIDGAQYFHLKQLFDTTASTAIANTIPIDNHTKQDSLNSKKKQRKVALSFEGSDVKLLNRTNKSSEVKRYKKVNNEIRNYTQPIFGLSSYQFYNVTNFSYSSSTNKVYFTVNQNKETSSAKGTANIRSLRIAEAELHDLTLTNINVLPIEIDSSYSIMHPAIHPNGRFLVFSSNQTNNQFDLYYSIKDSLGWSKPKSLDSLNTIGDEVFPSFTPDGNLYFSSNGRAGLGGQDIYSVKLGIFGGDSKIEHLSYPINSSYDDFGLTYNLNNSATAYFSSDRNGSDDIYLFEKNPVNIKIDGFVLNDSTKLRNKDVTVYLREDIGNGNTSIIDSVITDITGNYHFISKPNRRYTISIKDSINISKDLFVSNIDNLLDKNLPIVSLKSKEQINGIAILSTVINKDTTKQSNQESSANLKLQINTNDKIEDKTNVDTIKKIGLNVNASKTNIVNVIETLSDTSESKYIVYYQLNKFILNTKGHIVLDSLLTALQKDVKLNVVIGSFTDCIGSIPYNMMLSNKRSKATIEYLISHGLSMSRISESHYGKNYLDISCAPNNYQASQQFLNRRTEIYLTKETNLSWLDLHNKNSKATSIVAKDTQGFIDNAKKVVGQLNQISTKLEKEIIQKRKDSTLLIKKNLLLTNKINAINNSRKLKLIKDSLLASKKMSDSLLNLSVLRNKVIANDRKIRIQDSIKLAANKRDSILNSIDLVNRKIAQKKNKQSLDSMSQVYKKADTLTQSKGTTNSKNQDVQIRKQNLLQTEKYQDTLLQLLLKKDSIHQQSLKNLSGNKIEKIVAKDVRNLTSSLDTINQQEINTMVSYLTNRINKKPIEVYVNSENITVDLYDNGIHDKDSISIIYNKKFVVYKNELKTDQSIHFKLKVSQDKSNNTLIMIAENLGIEPPNTAAMFITDDTGKKQIVYLTTDLTHNEVVYFIRMNKNETVK